MANRYFTNTFQGRSTTPFGSLINPTTLAAVFRSIQAGFDKVQTEMPVAAGASGAIPMFGTAGTNLVSSAMRQDTNGNIGLGTVSPQGKLHVVGGQPIGDGATPKADVNYAFNALWPAYEVAKTRMVIQAIGVGEMGIALQVRKTATSAPVDALDILPDGSAGLGAAAVPGVPLTVGGHVGLPARAILGLDPATDRFTENGALIGANGVTVGTRMLGAGDDATAIAGDEGVILAVAKKIVGMLRAGGDLGLGTTSPIGRLHLKKNGMVRLALEGDGTADAQIRAYQNTLMRFIQDSFADITWEISNVEVARMTRHGNMGIGIASPASKLHVAGQVRALGFLTVSDVRTKENIQGAQDCGQALDSIKMVSYTVKATGERVDQGVIAQQLHTVVPSAVVQGDHETDWAVDYVKLIPYMLNEIQQLRRRAANAEARINELRTGNV